MLNFVFYHKILYLYLVSSLNMPQCPGCQRQFSGPGLTSHIIQTKNPQCKEIWAQLQGELQSTI